MAELRLTSNPPYQLSVSSNAITNVMAGSVGRLEHALQAMTLLRDQYDCDIYILDVLTGIRLGTFPVGAADITWHEET